MRHSLDPVIVTVCEAKPMAAPPGQLNVHRSNAIRLPAERTVDAYPKNENATDAAPVVSKTEFSTIQLLFCLMTIGVRSSANALLRDEGDEIVDLQELNDHWLLEEIVAAEDCRRNAAL